MLHLYLCLLCISKNQQEVRRPLLRLLPESRGRSPDLSSDKWRLVQLVPHTVLDAIFLKENILSGGQLHSLHDVIQPLSQ